MNEEVKQPYYLNEIFSLLAQVVLAGIITIWQADKLSSLAICANGSLSNNHFSRRKLIVLNTIHESHKMLKIWLSTD